MHQRDIELLYEIGTLRHIARTWHQFGGVDFANVTEHCFRVAWLSMMLAQLEGADVGKVVQMALIHDIGETRTGDVNYMSRMYTARNEQDAMHHSVAGTCIENLVRGLWDEYEARKTLEAKIVKDADSLDCDLDLAEKRESAPMLFEALKPTRAAVYEQLHTESARRLFEAIKSSDPHSWHISGRNRLTAGDWQRFLPPLQRELPLSKSEESSADLTSVEKDDKGER